MSRFDELKRFGLKKAPKVAVGDGALGLERITQAFGGTRRQRCWMHKTGNVFDKLPKHVQARARKHLHQNLEDWDKQQAKKSFVHFVKSYKRNSKAAEYLAKDRDVLLTFYNFPVDHCIHLRITNLRFATVGLRIAKEFLPELMF